MCTKKPRRRSINRPGIHPNSRHSRPSLSMARGAGAPADRTRQGSVADVCSAVREVDDPQIISPGFNNFTRPATIFGCFPFFPMRFRSTPCSPGVPVRARNAIGIERSSRRGDRRRDREAYQRSPFPRQDGRRSARPRFCSRSKWSAGRWKSRTRQARMSTRRSRRWNGRPNGLVLGRAAADGRFPRRPWSHHAEEFGGRTTASIQDCSYCRRHRIV